MEEKLNFERNLLTKGLLAAGYTVENHPDYVEVQHYCGMGKSLDNFDGGFTGGFMNRHSGHHAGCYVRDDSAIAACPTWASDGLLKTTWQRCAAHMRKPAAG